MTLKDLKRLSHSRVFRAVVRHEDRNRYSIELSHEHGAGLLRGWTGEPLSFKSLMEVHRVMHEYGVQQIELPESLAA